MNVRPIDALLIRERLLLERHDLSGRLSDMLAATGDIPDAMVIPSAWVATSPGQLDRAPLYFLTPDMVTLTHTAGGQFDHQLPLPMEPPTRDGFMLFGREVREPGLAETVTGPSGAHAVSWHQYEAGETRLAYLEEGPTTEFWLYGIDQDGPGAIGGGSWPADRGVTLMPHGPWELVEGDWWGELIKATVAAWALMAQTLTETTEEHDRAANRRLARQGRPAAPVVIVHLRRAERPATSAGGTVDWSHRWLVTGHWRNQYIPNTGRHRPTWIAGYVKGPDDKPLALKERITVLER